MRGRAHKGIAAAVAVVAVLATGVALSSAALDNYRPAVEADSPAAYWRLGEASGNALVDGSGTNTGTYGGTFTLGLAGALWSDANTAASFDGVTGNASAPDANALDFSSGASVELWVRRRASGIWQPLVGKPLNGQSKLENYSIWINTSNRPVAYFGNGTSYVQVQGTTALDGSWHHVVSTYNNATARLYVDGAQVATATSTIQLTPNANAVNIARSQFGSSYAGVDLDEVALYPTALSAVRVAAHYSAGRSDAEVPQVTVTSPAEGALLSGTTPTFSGAAGTLGGDSTTVTVKVYAGAQATGTPAQTLTTTRSGSSYSAQATSLADGPYVARAEQRDDANNIGLSNVRAFTIDTTPPVASITQTPPDPSNSASASFTFTANEAATFACRVDGAVFAPCSSPAGLSGLSDASHTFQVKATDGAGNTGAAASSTWQIDTVAPSVTITGGPTGTVTSTQATVTFTTSETSSSECSLDNAAFASCSSPVDYSGLADGGHTVRVRATDAAGNSGSIASRSWTVDTTAPAVALTQPPAGSTTNDDTPTLAGNAGQQPGDSGTVTVSVYEGSAASGSPIQVHSASVQANGTFSVDATPALSNGTYTVRASQDDSFGHTGLSAAVTFDVDTGGDDTTPPTVNLSTPGYGSATSDTTPAFSGTGGTHLGDLDQIEVSIWAGTSATGPPAQTLNTVRSVLDGTFSVDSAALDDGLYVARASQSDAAGNVGNSALTSFEVDTTAPTASITASPPAASNSSQASLSFSSNEAGSTFSCQLDSGPVVFCASPMVYSGLDDDDHDFSVTATDRAGNTSDAATVAWVVDTVAPSASITSGPSGPTSSSSATFGFSVDEPGSFRCKLDSGSFSSCTSPVSYSGLSEGSHSVSVEPTDVAGNVGSVVGRSWSVDTVAPAVTLTSPANSSSSAWPKPSFGGVAGTQSGDVASVTVRLYSGSSATGSPIQTLAVTPAGGGGYTTTVPSFLQPGTYTARSTQVDAAGNAGDSSANTFTITDPVVMAAGDISSCEESDGDQATSDILVANPDAIVAPLGDTAYPDGTAAQFANCYDPTWGRVYDRTYPVVGDHEYATPNASGYFNYFYNRLIPFGADAVNPTKGNYSYDVGAWHILALNSNCTIVGGCNEGSAFETWVRADLAAHPNVCTMAYMQHQRFSSGSVHGNNPALQPIWQALYDAGVELVLNGNEHIYERFAPQTAAGVADPSHGVRQITVGSGGYFHYAIGTIQPNSEVRNVDTYGVLKLTLHSGGYDWQFMPEAGKTFADSGSGSCHGTPPPPPPPPPGAPTVRSSSSNVANSSTSIAFAAPTGTAAGDVLVAVASHQAGQARNMTAPAGWTAVPNADWAEGNNARIHAWYKVATGFEPLSYTFNLTGGSGQDISGGILALQGASTSAPINVSNGQSNGSSPSKDVKAPSITTTVANTLEIFAGSCSASTTYTPPSGFSEQWDRATSGAYKISAEVAVKGQATAGATGVLTASAANSCRSVGINIAVRPPG